MQFRSPLTFNKRPIGTRLEKLEDRHLLAATIVNLPAENVGPTSATIGFEVVDTGGTIPNVAVYWGKTDRGPSTSGWDNRIRAGDLDVGTYTQELTGLEIGTQYFFRTYGFSLLGGVSWAPETTSFQTTPPAMPTVISDVPSPPGSTAIVVSGTVTDQGGQIPTVTVYYGDNDGRDNPADWDQSIGLGEAEDSFATRIGRLHTNTDYFYRFAATNNGGTGWTETISFRTPDVPALQVSEISAAGGTELTTRVRGSAEADFGGAELEYDWIEIENTTDSPMDISNYFITDRKARPKRWQFPEGTVVPEFGTLTVFASGFDVSDSARDETGRLHTNFKLDRDGEYVGLFNSASELVHALDRFPALFPGLTYGIFGDQQQYFSSPSPAEVNLAGAPKLVPPPTISIPGRTFTESLEVEFQTSLEGGLIRYTTDGEVPNDESPLYEGPITVSESTVFRVRTFAEGHAPSELVSESYIKFDPEVAGYTSDLPIIVLDNFGGRRPSKARQVPFQLMLFDVDPETGHSSIDATPDLHTRIGMKVRGQSSSNDPKTPYRLELRNQYEEDVDHGLLGLPSESDWVLQGPWSDRTLMHNAIAYELAGSIGLDAPRTRYVEVFRNQRAGSMEADDFLGLYVLTENIKRSENRVDITKLTPGEFTEPDISGGYIIRFEQNVSESRDRLRGWNHLELLDGQKYTAEQKEWITNHVNEVDAAIEKADESRDYENFIGVDSMVNMLLISELGRDQDAYVRSHYYYKDRGGILISGPIWDFNLIWNRGCCFDNRNPRGWQFDQDRPGSPNGWNKGQHNWYGDLMDSPAFAQKVIDRWAELRSDGNPFSLTALNNRIDGHVEQIRAAAERNYTRWDNQLTSSSGFGGPRFPTWQEHIDDMKAWIQRRVAWIDEQFQTRPTIEVDEQLTVTLQSESGQIYYTLDGSDPFDHDTGEPSVAAMLYEIPFSISEGMQVSARVRNPSVAPRRTEMVLTQWSSAANYGEVAPGDLNGDGNIDVDDIQALCGQISNGGPADARFDLNGDNAVGPSDMDELVNNILKTSYGDANLDGIFNSRDLTEIFQKQEYEDSIDGNSTWSSGDWNCDGDFTSRDLVFAFVHGDYSLAAKNHRFMSDIALALNDLQIPSQLPDNDLTRFKR